MSLPMTPGFAAFAVFTDEDRSVSIESVAFVDLDESTSSSRVLYFVAGWGWVPCESDLRTTESKSVHFVGTLAQCVRYVRGDMLGRHAFRSWDFSCCLPWIPAEELVASEEP